MTASAPPPATLSLLVLALLFPLFVAAGPYEDGATAAVAGQFERAAALWLPAARRGDVRAQVALGRLYADGRGVERDLEQAVDWFDKAAGRGDAGGRFHLALMIERGLGTAADAGMAAKLFRQAAEQGHAGAALRHGTYLLADPDKERAEGARWITRAAEQGNLQAMAVLGGLYATGSGVEQDDGLALKWLRQAAEKGAPGAQVNLGQMIATGRGTEANLASAAAWYKRAADQGFAQGQLRLALAHASGQGVPRDDAAARALLAQAARQGLPAAQLLFADYLAAGRGGARDLLLARSIYVGLSRRGGQIAGERLVALDQELGKRQRIVTAASARLSDGPGQERKAIGQVSRGATVYALGATKGWVRVNVPGSGVPRVGWIHSSLIAKPGAGNSTAAPPAATPTPTPTADPDADVYNSPD